MTEDATAPISDEDLATAYHEAGHAIAAVALGKPVAKVTIERNSMRLGQCQMSQRRGQPVKDELEVQMMILLAGVVAEARFTGDYNWDGARQDMIGIRRLTRIRAGSNAQAERLQNKMLAKTDHLLDQSGHWESIIAIVEERKKSKSLSGRAVQHVFESTMARINT
jgi:ATP-dependent Zn protease